MKKGQPNQSKLQPSNSAAKHSAADKVRRKKTTNNNQLMVWCGVVWCGVVWWCADVL
jgi:hypothetical protein